MKKLGIYLHIPFCRKKCEYCNFYSIPIKPRSDYSYIIDNYVDALIREINLRLPLLSDYIIDTVYFGGGTPSLLPVEHVEKLLNTVQQHLKIEKRAEISLEMNPEDMDFTYIESLIQLMINRIILGVQTIDASANNTIGRSASVCDLQLIEHFCAIPNIIHCIDIIGAIPGYSVDKYINDLTKIVAKDIQHVSMYLLTLEKNTLLHSRLVKQLDDDFYIEIFKTTIDIFKRHGFQHYEISNFAKEVNISRHNMKYWTYQPYIGLGTGAHSFYNRQRFINTMSVESYIKAQEPNIIEDKRSIQGEMVEYMLTGLRLSEGISLGQMAEQLGCTVPQAVYDAFGSLAESGLVCFDNNKVSLTEKGLFMADSVIYKAVESML